MSDKKGAEDNKETEPKKAEASTSELKSKSIDIKFMLLCIAFLACALAFLPTSLLLFFGLMPTFAALVIDPTPDRVKTMTVGCMNVAGVVPFLLKIWTNPQGQSVSDAFAIIAQAETLVTIYGAAAVGYAIFYAVTGCVSAYMLQNGRARLEYVTKKMGDLERKWGREVTGAIPLDERGFPDMDAEEDL